LAPRRVKRMNIGRRMARLSYASLTEVSRRGSVVPTAAGFAVSSIDTCEVDMKATAAMKIVVIGGSGLIGKKVVTNLRQHGHEVVAASPSSGVNTVTGEGLAQALAGAQVVVDVANAPSWEDKAVLAFFEASGRNLLADEAAAGVGHHVALSVVGTDRLLASGYFRAKMAQEKLIKASPIP